MHLVAFKKQWWIGLCVAIATVMAPNRASADTLSLMWDPSPDASVAGYVVYAGTQSQVYAATYDVGNATSFVFDVALAGQQYCFAVAAYVQGSLPGPLSSEVCGSVGGFIDTPPVLINPGDQTSPVGQPVTLQLTGSDPSGQPVSYSATGLPPGLGIVASSGFVSGTPTSAGTYTVTAIVSDGVLSDAEMFVWTTVAPALDLNPPTVTITVPTPSERYTTGEAYVVLGGHANDDVQVAAVRWANDRGGSGVATGTSSWLAGVLLHPGRNDITITATDEAGNPGRVVISVYCQSLDQ